MGVTSVTLRIRVTPVHSRSTYRTQHFNHRALAYVTVSGPTHNKLRCAVLRRSNATPAARAQLLQNCIAPATVLLHEHMPRHWRSHAASPVKVLRKYD
jgi:hypothetical protein